MNAFLKIIAVVLGTALVLVIWYHASPIIVMLLDFNLKLIKWGCAVLPSPYGSMAESALRVGLAADKALIFAEGTWLVGGLLRLIFSQNKKSGALAMARR